MFLLRNTNLKLTAIAVLTLALGAAALAKTHSDPSFPQIKIKNFGKMDERFYRGAQPKESDYTDLKALGISTVIDLTEEPKEFARPTVEALGMKYVNIAIPDKQDPTDKQVQDFLKLVGDPATGRFYVHCAGGRHRTGVMGAVYRFTNYGWNYDQVYAEMKDFDFYSSWGHGGQKKYVQNYAQRVLNDTAATATSTKQ